MDDVIHLPDSRLHFQYGDKTLSLDPIDALEKMAEIHKGNPENDQLAARIDAFRAWIKQVTGSDLPRCDADALWDAVQQAFVVAKKKRHELLNWSQPESAPSN